MLNRAPRLLALLPALLLALLLSPHAAAPGQAMSLAHQQQQQQLQQLQLQQQQHPQQQLQHRRAEQPADAELAALASAGLEAAQALASHASFAAAYDLEPSSATAARHAGSILNDWIAYNKRGLPAQPLSEDRLVLLDNVLSAVLRNVYKHRQQVAAAAAAQPAQRQRRRQQLHHPDRTHAWRSYDSPDPAEPEEGPRLLAEAPLRRREQPQSRAPGKRNQHQQPSNQLPRQEAKPQPPSKSQSPDPASAVAAATAGMASQFLLRSARGNRQYDVPQIECPMSDDGMERFACPTPDRMGRYRCIEDHVLCDGFIDCPQGEDEDRQGCMFYKTTKAHLDVLADALLRWARGRR